VSATRSGADQPQHSFTADLGAESVQSIELVAMFEEEFGIEMDEDAAMAVQTSAPRRSSSIRSVRHRASWSKHREEMNRACIAVVTLLLTISIPRSMALQSRADFC